MLMIPPPLQPKVVALVAVEGDGWAKFAEDNDAVGARISSGGSRIGLNMYGDTEEDEELFLCGRCCCCCCF